MLYISLALALRDIICSIRFFWKYYILYKNYLLCREKRKNSCVIIIGST